MLTTWEVLSPPQAVLFTTIYAKIQSKKNQISFIYCTVPFIVVFTVVNLMFIENMNIIN